MSEAFDMNMAAALQGMLRAVEQRRRGGSGLHELAGLFHCSHGDTAQVARWLRLMAHKLGLQRAWLLESHGGGGVWRAACSDGAQVSLQGWTLPDLAAAPEGYAVIECSDDVSGALPRSEALRQALPEAGDAWVCAGVVKTAPDRLAALVLLHAGAPRTAPDLADDLTRLLWHVYLQCRAQPAPATGLPVTQLLRMLPLPGLLTDSLGRCIERNPPFDAALARLQARAVTGRLRFMDASVQAAWQSALAEVYTTATQRTLVLGAGWQVHLAPVSAPEGSAPAGLRQAVLALFVPTRADDAQAADAMLSGVGARLTRAEVEVLRRVLQGQTAKIIASARGASVNTVRSQIMAVLGKTGHHNQKSLMAAFGASAFGASEFGDSVAPHAGGAALRTGTPGASAP